MDKKISKFKYSGGGRVSGIKEVYLRYLEDNDLPIRCDNSECFFNKNEPIWNNKTLTLILDHINGVNSDNRLKNLRLLCPNCNSQLSETHGGRNRGRVEKSSGGFAIIQKNGKRNYVLPVETGVFEVKFGEIKGILKHSDSENVD